MSELALHLIRENKQKRARGEDAGFLDLGNCDLTEVPQEIGELVWLETLSFSSEWWDENKRNITNNTGRANKLRRLIPSVSALTNIKILLGDSVKPNPFSRLTNLKKLSLSGLSKLDDLSPLAGLTNLQTLRISGTKVTDLTPLSELTSLQSLYVSGTQVSNLTPLSGLTSLQTLDISRMPVTDLTPLSELTSLQELNVSGTKVTDLTPLSGLANLQTLDVSGMQVSDLTPLSGLTSLQSLYVSGWWVTDLTPLAGLASLQWLDVSRAHVNDLSPLAGLASLQWLDLSRARVSDLTPLSGLTSLRNLCVSETRVTDLTPLSRLANLRRLDVSRTKVTDLVLLRPLIEKGVPVKWSAKAWEGIGIYVEACLLTNPPAEVVKEGNEAILNYFREKDRQGVDHLYEAKMLIVGEGGAGKTSLLRRLYQTEKPLPKENETTKGIAIHRHEFPLLNERRFRLNVWDFGGQEIYKHTHQFFLTKRSLYVLLDDTRKDHKTVHDEGFQYWLEVVDLLSDHSPMLIFQNEKGGRSKPIDLAGIKGKFDNVKDLYGGNLEQPGAADGLREAVEFFVQRLPHIGEELPAKWVTIRADIEERAEREPYISHTDYFQIYGQHLEFDRAKALHLSHYLHDLGVFLHYQDDPLLARTVILQNQWATEAVFKMLDDETVKGQLGRFTAADCARVWKHSVYADMHPELLALMQKFELCYRLPDSRSETWLAPQLLPPSKPVELADWERPGDLVLRYRYEFLPKGMVSRLMVRLHRFVSRPEMGWVTGVLFERDGTEVLAEVPPKGGEIVLHARGPERKELLSIIAADLDALNESFPGLREKVGKWVPCNCRRCLALTQPEFFEQKRLLQRKKDGKLNVECPASYEDVDVLELLDGIKVDRLPGWAKEETLAKASASQSEQSERTIKIFLASSSELREDRDEFDLYFRRQNDSLRKRGVYLEIIRWEYFLDAMSETRLQDEYNKEVQGCDVFVSLFFTKPSKFTEEEFDTAYRQFKEAGKPLIYTFFKNADIKTGSANKQDLKSLWAFQETLSVLGHFHTGYDNIEHLKRQFKDQLEKLLEKGFSTGQLSGQMRYSAIEDN